MNTTTVSANIFNLNVRQLLQLACSNDIDAAEFGHRALRWMALAAKDHRNDVEQRDIVNLFTVLNNNLCNDHFRAHLVEVLHPVTVTDINGDAL